MEGDVARVGETLRLVTVQFRVWNRIQNPILQLVPKTCVPQIALCGRSRVRRVCGPTFTAALPTSYIFPLDTVALTSQREQGTSRLSTSGIPASRLRPQSQ